MPAAWAASTNRRKSSGVPYPWYGANWWVPSYPQPNRPGNSATGITSRQVMPQSANSGSSRIAAAKVPSRVNVPTCSSYRTVPSSFTPRHEASVQANPDGSTTSDGPCGPSGCERDAGSL